MTVITRLSIGESDPTKTNSAINQIAEYIDRTESSWLNIRVKVGTFTRDTSLASGTQAVTGVGFTPKAVIFLSGDESSAVDASMGFDDGTTSRSIYNVYATTAGNWQAIDAAIRLHQSAANIYNGAVLSLNSDGFTIRWVKTGSPTGTKTIAYLAIA